MISHPWSGLGNQDTDSVARGGNFSLEALTHTHSPPPHTHTHTHTHTHSHTHTQRLAHQGQSCAAESEWVVMGRA